MRVIVGMATTPERLEFAEVAVQSLRPQVDDIRLFINSEENYADNAKFYWLSDYAEPVFFFSCDDDIIYPSDYVERTLQAIDKHKCIVSYHGRILTGLNRNYYKDHLGFSCLKTVRADVEVDVAGTGVTAFRTDYFNPTDIYKSPYKRMSDLIFSLEAAKQNKRIIVIKHREGYFTDLCVPKDLTIYSSEFNNPQLTEVANKIYYERY